MTKACMYCGTGPSKGEASSVLLDFSARGLAVVRTVQEMRKAECGWRQVAAQVIGRDDAPELDAVPRIRLCPYCRQTHMTALGPATLWTDFVVRLFGLGQGFLGARKGGLRGLASALVDGDDVPMKPHVVHTQEPAGPDVYDPEEPKKRWPRKKRSSKR